jgi:hypothetical protein
MRVYSGTASRARHNPRNRKNVEHLEGQTPNSQAQVKAQEMGNFLLETGKNIFTTRQKGQIPDGSSEANLFPISAHAVEVGVEFEVVVLDFEAAFATAAAKSNANSFIFRVRG